MEFVLIIVRLFLFGVFALAGIGKLLDLRGAEKAVKEFGVPEKFVRAFAIGLPLIEIAIAVSFLFVGSSWYGAAAGSLLLLVFIAGMAWQISHGRAPDCHCFGQIHSEPVGKRSMIRNIIFAVIALFLVVRGPAGQGDPLADGNSGVMQTVLILIVAAISAAIVFYLKKVFEQQNQILRRLEILELVSREGVAVERSEAGDPNDSLPIGSPFPDFTLPDLSGRSVNLEQLLARRKPILFFFVSPTCSPCTALLPDLLRWREELTEKLEIVLITSGSEAENREKFASEFSGKVLLQREREVADLVRARWTPTALLVRGDGTIASHIAAGDTAIRGLVERAAAQDLSSKLSYVANGSGKAPKIGDRAPKFTLSGIDGTSVSSERLRGQKTLAVFWSQGCPHCKNMIEELKSWEENRAPEDPALLIFTDGEPEDHAAIGLSSPILIDEEYKISMKLGMLGTPSAVLIDEEGRIITETATGAPNIWALIGRRN